MSADQIAQISPAVREVLESRADTMCATLDVAGHPDAWVQVMKGMINSAYPRASAPGDSLLPVLACLPGSIVDSWEAGNFVTIAFQSTSPGDVAKAVDVLLRTLFEVGDYSVDCTVQEL